MTKTQASAGPEALHERATQLSALDAMRAAVAETGRGRLALVYGEAGIGKTALVRRLAADAPASARVLWGVCDELFTPRALGPLFDIAPATGGQVAGVLGRNGTPFEVASAVAETLTPERLTIMVLEDVHLADEGTLDVVRILGTRLADLPLLLILTYRDDAVGRWHPLRIVLGEVSASTRVERMRLAPLSPEAVAAMASEFGASADELYRKTSGNPFFVTEALAAHDARVPDTVRDAVLGRVARLSPGARRILDAIAILQPQAELRLLEPFAGDDIASLDEAIASGVVTAGRDAVAFRHELARLAVEEAMPVHRRHVLHRRALDLLAEPSPAGNPEPARLAHHADAVGDAALVLRFAPPAAAHASAMGAHRQAASHYRAALGFAKAVPPQARAQLYEGSAWESYLTIDLQPAVAAEREAIRCYEELGERAGEGAAATFLSQLLWQSGSLGEALTAVERSLALLDDLPDLDRVNACVMMTALQLADEDAATALRWAKRAEQEAGRAAGSDGRAQALLAIGWVELFTGRPGGLEKLDEALEIARQAGDDALMGLCYVIIVRTACRRREFGLAEPYIRAGLQHCVARDLDIWRFYLLSWHAKVLLARGRWTEAAQAAQICIAEPCPFARIHALVALGLVRARRGDPDAWGPLDEAVELAAPRHELQWIAPVAIARAEAAWLEGRDHDVVGEVDLAWGDAAGTWYSAALTYWRRRVGADDPVPEVGEEPYRLELAGDWSAASELWRARGCPYDAALALIDGDEPALRRALEELRAMGANPAAQRVMRHLRDRGARGVPRGPRARTRDNPAGLTGRELEVLALVTEGLRNAEIAQRLVVSERTVDHHVSAILRKLDVPSRGRAGAAATRMGITGLNS